MKTALIITGGDINLEFAADYVSKNQFDIIIVADGGLEAADKIGLIPNFVVGDFDTVNPLLLSKYENADSIEIIRFKPEKDYTDTHIAFKKALELQCYTIRILGATGSRLDHTIANIQLMQYALEIGIDAEIVGDKNRIRLLGLKRKEVILKKDADRYSYRYVSLIPVSDQVTNVSTKGMKYNLTNYTFYINKNVSLGVSNEILDEYASISIGEGNLLVIESND